MTEDQHQRQPHHQTSSAETATTTSNATAIKEHPKSIHEIRNQDLISRFLAATPPYLYSAPIGPSNFFFSDMLRSLVQARNSENTRNFHHLQQQTTAAAAAAAALIRRPRKRSWSQHRSPYYEQLKERKDLINLPDEKPTTTCGSSSEKPLELTNKQNFSASSSLMSSKFNTIITKHSTNENQLRIKYTSDNGKCHQNDNEKMQEDSKLQPTKTINVQDYHHRHPQDHQSFTNTAANSSNDTANVPNIPSTENVNPIIPDPPAASLPPSELVLPPPPPVWYPPLYPTYGIDPLHFFIDLRVSGHIYDRKKENISPSGSTSSNSLSLSSTVHQNPTGEGGNNNTSGTRNILEGNSENSSFNTEFNELHKQHHHHHHHQHNHNHHHQGSHRYGSAFTVPTPRNENLKNSSANASSSSTIATAGTVSAMNLSSNNNFSSETAVIDADNFSNQIHNSKYYDLLSATNKGENLSISKNANYVLQNLPRIYTQNFHGKIFNENDNTEEKRLIPLYEKDNDESNGSGNSGDCSNNNLIDIEEIENYKSTIINSNNNNNNNNHNSSNNNNTNGKNSSERKQTSPEHENQIYQID